MSSFRDAAGAIPRESRRGEAAPEGLAGLCGERGALAEVAHEARNMVTALGLYCDLLEEPGVLASPYERYGGELRLVAAASRRLVERLAALDGREAAELTRLPEALSASRRRSLRRQNPAAAAPVENLAEEVLGNMNLLSALAGAARPVRFEAAGGGWPVRLSSEELTRILVNLVRNAVEALPAGGAITVRLTEPTRGPGSAAVLQLSVDDNGPGIPPEDLERIFQAGYSSRAGDPGSAALRRGLGLAIVRATVEAAGGRAYAENLSPSGARLTLELPVRSA